MTADPIIQTLEEVPIAPIGQKEGSPQEPLFQSTEEAATPPAPQELLGQSLSAGSKLELLAQITATTKELSLQEPSP